ncbi:MAG: cytochrome c oxidase subunit II [Opitutaceae bacterium]|nr:cytochrome c oxidase subunit II [Opitutaceae bacterium]
MQKPSPTLLAFGDIAYQTFSFPHDHMPTLHSTIARCARAAAALAGVVLLAGCDKINFWRMDGHQSTIVVEGPVAREQLDLFIITCWVSLVIFIVVGAVLAYATFKFRARSADDEHAEPPPQGHGNPLIELSLIVASVLALVVIAIPTMKGIWNTYDVPEAERKDAYEVTATGYQWWFKFEYKSETAMTDAKGGKTPLITANELVIPAGRAVRIHLRSFDVIHSFWVPKLGGKVDMIPNRANILYLKADKPGYFWGQCAEYCGDSHAVMRFRVIALDKKEFAEWLEQQAQLGRTVTPSIASTPAPRGQFAALRQFKENEAGITIAYDTEPLKAWRTKQDPEKNEDPALIAQGREVFKKNSCANCHTIRGHDAGGVTAPDLTHFGSRTTLAGGLLENDATQLRRWIHDPLAVKPGNKMHFGVGAMAGYVKKNDSGKGYTRNITLTADDEVALVAYLHSLK